MPRSMETSSHACYGYHVICSYEPDAWPCVRSFFGPEQVERIAPMPGLSTLHITLRVSDTEAGPTLEPPHNLDVMMANPVVMDVGSSRAVLYPDAARAEITLGRADRDNAIVWGRWMLERLFVYLVCRSPRHYPLHAGAIAVDGQAAVLTAAGGVGKSTFTFWAMQRGAELVGEDILVRHLDDPSGTLWGYPRALYLSPEMLSRSDVLKTARVSRVNDAKYRVSVPDELSTRWRTGLQPTCLIFLTRGAVGAPLCSVGLEEAIERCRPDFAIAKDDVAVAEVAADLRRVFRSAPIWEFGVSEDLDESYERLRTALRTIPRVAA